MLLLLIQNSGNIKYNLDSADKLTGHYMRGGGYTIRLTISGLSRHIQAFIILSSCHILMPKNVHIFKYTINISRATHHYLWNVILPEPGFDDRYWQKDIYISIKKY